MLVKLCFVHVVVLYCIVLCCDLTDVYVVL